MAYTFDAGPNATLFLLEKDVPELLGILDHYFPPVVDNNVEYRKGISIEVTPSSQVCLLICCFS